jgi:hypothetical protein
MARRAKRLSAVAEIIETFDDPRERVRVIGKLEGCGMLSAQVAALLREAYAGEPAE